MREFTHDSPTMRRDDVIATWEYRRLMRLLTGLIPAGVLLAPIVPFTSAWCSDHFALWLLGSVAVVAASASSASLGHLSRCPRCEGRVPGISGPNDCPHCGTPLK